MTDYEPMMDVARGDPALSGELRDALALLRDGSDNDEFRTLVDDVLAGRCSLSEASRTAAFNDAVFALVPGVDECCAYITESEKQGLAQGNSHGGEGSGVPCGCSGVCAGHRASPPR